VLELTFYCGLKYVFHSEIASWGIYIYREREREREK
jgi:hypothetical protein